MPFLGITIFTDGSKIETGTVSGIIDDLNICISGRLPNTCAVYLVKNYVINLATTEINQFYCCISNVELKWLPSHSDIEDNEMDGECAVMGSKMGSLE